MKNFSIVFIVVIFCGGGLAARAAEVTAFTPANPPEMQPLTNHVSPADRAAKLFLHGANLGNYLEVPPGQNWGVTFSADELTAMKREGFDHVRVPIGWQHYAGPAPGLERRFSILKSGGKPRADGNARRAF